MKSGEMVCRAHRRSDWGNEVAAAFREVMSKAIVASEDDDQEERVKTKELFRRRVARGDYGELFDEPVRRILEQGAEEKSLDQELAALRMMMARLVMDDEDPVRQALGLSRVTTAAARVLKTQNSMVAPMLARSPWPRSRR